MKINGIRPPYAVQAYLQRQEQVRPNHTGSAKKDEVRISAEAKEFLGATRLNDEQMRARVEELKRAYESGTYHVDAKKLANKLLPYIM